MSAAPPPVPPESQASDAQDDVATLVRQVAAALRFARWNGADAVDRSWAAPYAPPEPEPAADPQRRPLAVTQPPRPSLPVPRPLPAALLAPPPRSNTPPLRSNTPPLRSNTLPPHLAEPMRPTEPLLRMAPQQTLQPSTASAPTLRAPPADRQAALAALRARIGDCQRCPHAASRSRIVHGTGAAPARLMLIGSAPGPEEDAAGLPWQGDAGALLDKMLNAMGLQRAQVFATSLTLCRAPGDAPPDKLAITECSKFLRTQLEAVRPEVLLIFGEVPAKFLLRTTDPLAEMHGRWSTVLGVQALATWDPADLVRDPAKKRMAWADLQVVMGRLGLAKSAG